MTRNERVTAATSQEVRGWKSDVQCLEKIPADSWTWHHHRSRYRGDGGSGESAVSPALCGLRPALYGAHLNAGDYPVLQSLRAHPQMADARPAGLSPHGLHRGGALADDLASNLSPPYRTQFPIPLRHHGGAGDNDFPLHVLLAGIGGNGRGARGAPDRQRWSSAHQLGVYPQYAHRYHLRHVLLGGGDLGHYRRNGHGPAQQWGD